MQDTKAPTPARKRRRRAKFYLYLLAAVVALYVVSYVALSAAGGYETRASGRHRIAHGFAIPDAFYWQPFWGSGGVFQNADGSTTWDADVIGFLYAPALYLDQQYVHRTITFLRDDLTVDPEAVPSPDSLHRRERRATSFALWRLPELAPHGSAVP